VVVRGGYFGDCQLITFNDEFQDAVIGRGGWGVGL